MNGFITTREYRSIWDQKQDVKPDTFFRKWIPVKKGINEGEQGYRNACIELVLHYYTYLSRETILKNWGTNFEKAPAYLEPFLEQLDLRYEIEEHLRKAR